MTLRTLYVMDPIEAVNPDKDTTFALMLAAQARGDAVFVCGVSDLSARGERAFAVVLQLEVMRPTTPGGAFFRVVSTSHERCLDDFDVVWMRKDPPVDDAYLFACMVLDLCPPSTLVLNRPQSLRVVHEKMWALQFKELTPRTVVSAKPQVLVDFVKAEGRGVLKPLHLMGGMGVFAFDANDKNLRSAADLLTYDGKRMAIAQEFLPAVSHGDKRVILVDGEPIGAVLRVPRADDVRSNLHVGGSAVRADIDADDRRIAQTLAPQLRALGLFFVGIDVIGGKLTEVNVTSPTGVQEIDRLDGRTGEQQVCAIVWQRIDEKRQRKTP